MEYRRIGVMEYRRIGAMEGWTISRTSQSLKLILVLLACLFLFITITDELRR